VEFDMSLSPDGKYKNFSALKVVTAGATPVTAAPIVNGNSAAPAAGLAGGNKVAPDNYQPRMNRIGAQTRAIALLAIAQSEGIELVPEKIKKADKLDMLRGLVDELTDSLAADAWKATEPVESVSSEFEE